MSRSAFAVWRLQVNLKFKKLVPIWKLWRRRRHRYRLSFIRIILHNFGLRIRSNRGGKTDKTREYGIQWKHDHWILAPKSNWKFDFCFYYLKKRCWLLMWRLQNQRPTKVTSQSHDEMDAVTCSNCVPYRRRKWFRSDVRSGWWNNNDSILIK